MESLIERSKRSTDIYQNPISGSGQLLVIPKRCRKTYLEQMVNKNESNVKVVIDDEKNYKKFHDRLFENRGYIQQETGGLIKDEDFANIKPEGRRIVFTPEIIQGGFLDRGRWNEIQDEMIRRSILFDKVLSSRVGIIK